MLLILEVLTVFLVALAMSMVLAHALELPGKLRLDEHTYMALGTTSNEIIRCLSS